MSPASGDYLSRIAELLVAADRLVGPATRIELYDEAIRIADSHNDLDAGFRLRRELIEIAGQYQRYDIYGVTFAWCFAQSKRHPERFPTRDLLSHYQNVIGKLVNFLEFPRSQYEALFEDVIRHFHEHGFSPRTAYLERRSVAIDFGDPAMSEEADREWRKHPRGEMCFGTGFEVGRQIEFDNFREDDAAVIASAKRWFADDSRDDSCDLWVHSESLLPLLRAGLIGEAVSSQRQSDRGIRSGGGYIWSWGPHLSFLGLTGEFDRGLKRFQTMLTIAFDQPDWLSQFHFLEHALVFFRQLARSGREKVRLRTPTNFDWHEPGGVYQTAAVAAWIDAKAEQTARLFDERNGNSYHVELLAKRRDMDRWACKPL